MSRKRILIVGGAGTLGSDILESNINQNSLFVIDNFIDSVLSPEDVIKHSKLSDFDISEMEPAAEIFKEFSPEVVIYLATSLSNDARICYNANVLGLDNVIRLSENHNRPHIIFIQSFLTRCCDSKINEETSFSASDMYSTWKLAGELLLESYSGPKSNIILASVISPRITVGAIPAFAKRLQANLPIKVTETVRDYLGVSDFLSALEIVIDSNDGLGNVAIGSGLGLQTKEILRLTAQIMGISDPKFDISDPHPSDPRSVIIDSAKFKKTFGWQPNVNLESDFNKAIQNVLDLNVVVRLHH
jgi:UDP-glucose 4-epimerase